MPYFSRELTILLYHHVGAPPRSSVIRGLYVTARQFDWQIRQLKSMGARFVTCADLMDGEARDDDPGYRVMVTFDDGTRSVYHEAFPILRRHSIPAIVYPVVGDLGKEGVVWTQSADKSPRDILTEAQVREMAREGIEFGSHLYRHVRAAELPAEVLCEELTVSKERLEGILGATVLSVAYPFGSCSPAVTQAARAAGYLFGMSTRRGTNIGCDPMALCRVPVKGVRWHHYWYFRRFMFHFRRGARV